MALLAELDRLNEFGVIVPKRACYPYRNLIGIAYPYST